MNIFQSFSLVVVLIGIFAIVFQFLNSAYHKPCMICQQKSYENHDKENTGGFNDDEEEDSGIVLEEDSSSEDDILDSAALEKEKEI